MLTNLISSLNLEYPKINRTFKSMTLTFSNFKHVNYMWFCNCNCLKNRPNASNFQGYIYLGTTYKYLYLATQVVVLATVVDWQGGPVVAAPDY